MQLDSDPAQTDLSLPATSSGVQKRNRNAHLCAYICTHLHIYINLPACVHGPNRLETSLLLPKSH